jgi:hypothetical protein
MSAYVAFLDRLSDLIVCEVKKTVVLRKMEYVIDITEDTAMEIKSLMTEEYEWYKEFIKGAAK